MDRIRLDEEANYLVSTGKKWFSKFCFLHEENDNRDWLNKMGAKICLLSAHLLVCFDHPNLQ